MSAFSESLKVLLAFSLNNGCRNGSRVPKWYYLYHIRGNNCQDGCHRLFVPLFPCVQLEVLVCH